MSIICSIFYTCSLNSLLFVLLSELFLVSNGLGELFLFFFTGVIRIMHFLRAQIAPKMAAVGAREQLHFAIFRLTLHVAAFAFGRVSSFSLFRVERFKPRPNRSTSGVWGEALTRLFADGRPLFLRQTFCGHLKLQEPACLFKR